jgi:hypothetical protein
LLESPTVEEYITEFNVDGVIAVAKPHYKKWKSICKRNTMFHNVPKGVELLHIPTWKPKKWLKDRKRQET